MTTANQLISGALRVISSLSPGEAIPGAEADNALSVLNMMLAAWSADNLMIPYRTLESFALTGLPSYTMGTGGAFNTVRPDYVTNCYRRDANNRDWPVGMMTRDEYSGVTNKALTGNAYWAFYDPQYPLGVLYLYPASQGTLFVESMKPLNQFSSINATVNLPGEYHEAIKYLLAARLAPEYGFSITPDIATLIDAAEKRIKRKNIVPVAAVFDAGLGARPIFNINNG